MNKPYYVLISLVAYGLNITDKFDFTNDIKWTEVFTLAEKHGVLPLAFDGLERLIKENVGSNNLISKEYKLHLLGYVLNLEKLYERQKNVLCNLAHFYNKHNIRTLVLKGYGISLYYPIPSHRTCGDIDVYLYGDIDKSDGILEKAGVKIYRDNSHHSIFKIDGMMIENHRSLFDVEIHKSNLRFEKIFQELLQQPQDYIEIGGQTLFRPCATLNAIHLIRHTGGDFVFGKIMLRQIVDICVFFSSRPKIEWQYVLHVLKNEGMMPFYNAIATICVEYFNITPDCFVGYTSNVDIANKVLNEIFSDTHIIVENPPSIKAPKAFVSYCYNKSILLLRNKWKYKIVYKESMTDMLLHLAVKRILNR